MNLFSFDYLVPQQIYMTGDISILQQERCWATFVWILLLNLLFRSDCREDPQGSHRFDWKPLSVKRNADTILKFKFGCIYLDVLQFVWTEITSLWQKVARRHGLSSDSLCERHLGKQGCVQLKCYTGLKTICKWDELGVFDDFRPNMGVTFEFEPQVCFRRRSFAMTAPMQDSRFFSHQQSVWHESCIAWNVAVPVWWTKHFLGTSSGHQNDFDKSFTKAIRSFRNSGSRIHVENMQLWMDNVHCFSTPSSFLQLCLIPNLSAYPDRSCSLGRFRVRLLHLGRFETQSFLGFPENPGVLNSRSDHKQEFNLFVVEHWV